MSNLGDPITAIKDAQRPERIPWEDCILLLQVDGRFAEIGVLQVETGYFARLLRYNARIPEPELIKALKNTLDAQGIQTDRCQKTLLIFNSPHCVPVPEKVAEAGGLAALHAFLFTENPEEELQTDSGITDWQLQYTVNRRLLEEARACFKNLQIVHQQTALLKSRPEAEAAQLQLYLSYRPGLLSMAAFRNGQLQILQSFKAETVADILYVVLNFIEARKLPKAARVLLTGDFPEAEQVRERLALELGDAQWLALPERGQYPSALGNYSGHCFYHLVSLGLCE